MGIYRYILSILMCHRIIENYSVTPCAHSAWLCHPIILNYPQLFSIIRCHAPTRVPIILNYSQLLSIIYHVHWIILNYSQLFSIIEYSVPRFRP